MGMQVIADHSEDGLDVMLACSVSSPTAEAVRRGLGISILPSYIGRRYGGLVPIMPAWLWQPREIWLATHTEIVRTPRIRGVMDVISMIFEREQQDLKALYTLSQNLQDPDRPDAD